MSGFVLTPRGPFSARVDLAGALPGVDLSALTVGHGDRGVALTDLFELSGAAGDRLTIRGGSPFLDRVGAKLSSGEIVVEGDVGDHLGQTASGGRIVVSGSAGAYAAAELSGGRVEIAGDVGGRLGAARDGSRRGMS
ncbi:formylmethanofuran dehydrogenase subunit C, partial [Methylopila musalis]